MENIASQLSAYIEFPIDFEGQKKVDRLISYSVYSIGIIGVLVGVCTGNITYCFATCIAGIAALFVAVLPPWSCYNKDPVLWLKVKYDF